VDVTKIVRFDLVVYRLALMMLNVQHQ